MLQCELGDLDDSVALFCPLHQGRRYTTFDSGSGCIVDQSTFLDEDHETRTLTTPGERLQKCDVGGDLLERGPGGDGGRSILALHDCERLVNTALC